MRNFTLVGGDLVAAQITTLSQWGIVLLAALVLLGSFVALRTR